MARQYWLKTNDSVLSTLVYVCSKLVIRISDKGWEGIRSKESPCSYSDAIHGLCEKYRILRISKPHPFNFLLDQNLTANGITFQNHFNCTRYTKSNSTSLSFRKWAGRWKQHKGAGRGSCNKPAGEFFLTLNSITLLPFASAPGSRFSEWLTT